VKQIGDFRRTDSARYRETLNIHGCAITGGECGLSRWAGAGGCEEWSPESVDLGTADVGGGTFAGAENPGLHLQTPPADGRPKPFGGGLSEVVAELLGISDSQIGSFFTVRLVETGDQKCRARGFDAGSVKKESGCHLRVLPRRLRNWNAIAFARIPQVGAV
jgi:hypothetical protein